MGGKGGQTVGYWYKFAILAGLGRGKSNGLLAIEADDKIAWVGDLSEDTPTKINKPNLFGGEKKEGGIQGAFRLFGGATDQVLPASTTVSVASSGPVKSIVLPNVQSAIGGRVSQLRRVETLWYRGTVSANNYYPKEWHFCRWRTTEGWFGGEAWYPDKATIWMAGDGHQIETVFTETGGGIIGAILRVLNVGLGLGEQVDNKIRAMNPAHIIYECLTDPEWGAKRSPAIIDENSFILAANTLCSEGFGLCFNWARQEDVDVFIQTVIDHIAGVLYQDRENGKYTLRLIRDDYDPDDLPHYTDTSGLLEIEEDDSASSDEAINEVVVEGKDQSISGKGKKFEVRAYHNGCNNDEGAISQKIEFPGIPTRALALRVAQRELRVHASGLKRFKLKLDRRAWRMVPGAVFKVSSTKHNLSEIILRAGDVEHGTTDELEITVRAIEDVFGMPEATFQSNPPAVWVPPSQEATAAAATRLIEAGYRDILRRVGPSDITSLTPTQAFIGQLAQSANYAYQYELASKASGETEFVVRATGSFTNRTLLASAIAPLDTTMVVTDADIFEETATGEALMIDDEIVRFVSFDEGSMTATIARGCADTIPAPHAAGATVWNVDDDLTSDEREYASGETVETKVRTITPGDALELDDITPESISLDARQDKPYPPADVKIDGDSIFAMSGVYAEPTITFVDRDRVLQADQLLEHGAAGVGPEAGTTYTIRIKSADGVTTLRTDAAATSGWQYTSTMQTTDGSPTEVNVELESVRDSIVSWQHYDFNVRLSGGYGKSYGNNYGGA